MTAAPARLPTDGDQLLHKLRSIVRPSFQGDIVRIDPDDPVFARGRCRVVECERGAWSRLLCPAHYNRWRLHGRPDWDVFIATTGVIHLKPASDMTDVFDLRSLTEQTRLEIAYSIQCRHDDRTVRLLPTMISGLVALVVETGVVSLLEFSPDEWTAQAHARGLDNRSGRALGQLRYACRQLLDLAEGSDAESEFARDIWRASVLGVTHSRTPRTIRFDGIAQAWLRAAMKRCFRFRLAAGKSFGSVSVDERALRWFSRFLTSHYPDVTGPAGLTRQVLEHYLSWLAGSHLGGNTSNTYLVVLRGFLEACRRHHWVPDLPPRASIYLDELPARPRPLPRFIPEFVMAQIENPDNLARLTDHTTRHLLILIIETGLRANDACALPFNPINDDSAGWPCLRFLNSKMAAEQLVPLSRKAAEAVRAQQTQLVQRWPHGPDRLFPSPHANPDGNHEFRYNTFRTRLVLRLTS